MTAAQWLAVVLVYAVIVTALLVIALGAYAERDAELWRLRERVHPSTRNRRIHR